MVESSTLDYFDEIWVINLKRREDRLIRFWSEISNSNWPFHRPAVFSAIEGDKVGVPKFWQTGGGSYGCMRSHLGLLERAIQDDVESILVLEDDAIFKPSFGKDVAAFLEKVPDDWQCLMLGGQHVNSKPFPVLPGIVRAGAGGRCTHPAHSLLSVAILQRQHGKHVLTSDLLHRRLAVRNCNNRICFQIALLSWR